MCSLLSCHVVGTVAVGKQLRVWKGLVAGSILYLPGASLLLSTHASISLVVFNVTHIVLHLATTSHDALIGLLVLALFHIERVHAIGDVLANTVTAVGVLRLSVVLVPVEVNKRRAGVVSEQHVLGVIVDEVFLFGREVKVTDELSNAKLLDDVEDVELRVKSGASLNLELVLWRVAVAAAHAPRTREVLLAAEAPARVRERLAAIASLAQQVVRELGGVGGHARVLATVLLRLVHIVVQLLCCFSNPDRIA
jgi:hypothetical protein